jgi:hypothetical protein
MVRKERTFEGTLPSRQGNSQFIFFIRKKRANTGVKLSRRNRIHPRAVLWIRIWNQIRSDLSKIRIQGFGENHSGSGSGLEIKLM